MTRISYIHGLNYAPADELKDRAAGVSNMSGYVPYTAMTKGEFQLAMLRKQAEVFARYYPDQPKHAEAVRMLDNALYGGIHQRRAFVGVIPDSLQDLARQISRAAKFTAPAAGAMIGRTSIMEGIGDPILTYTEKDCVKYAMDKANKFYGKNYSWHTWENMPPIGNTKAPKQRYLSLKADCENEKAIEKLLNDKLVTGGHHMIYKELSPRYEPLLGTQVLNKRIFHLAGIGGLRNATGVANDQMATWVETAILQNNAASGVGTLGSVASSLSFSPGGEAELARYVAWATQAETKAAKDRAKGINEANIGIATAIIIGLITAALAAAQEILKGINLRKAAAMSAANGFGSDAYSGDPADYLRQGGSSGGDTPDKSANDMLPLLALGAGAYLLLND